MLVQLIKKKKKKKKNDNNNKKQNKTKKSVLLISGHQTLAQNMSANCSHKDSDTIKIFFIKRMPVIWILNSQWWSRVCMEMHGNKTKWVNLEAWAVMVILGLHEC